MNIGRNYSYTLSLTPGLLVVLGNWLGGWYVASNAVFSLVLLALLEKFVVENRSNQADEKAIFPEIMLHLHVILQSIILISLFYTLNTYSYSILQLLLLSLSVGINTGSSAIVVAHELIHRKNKYYRWLGKYLLLTAANVYFYVDHLRVHHKWVGTPRDHATARLGESVYRFYVRSVIGQISSSWKMEHERLKKAGVLQLILQHYVIASVIMIVLLEFIFYWFCGWKGIMVFTVQAFIAGFLLEYTNYIEHYGLVRNENQRVTELHSWQSDKVISRFFLIDLSRHADHHYYASKPFHTLRSYSNAPVLPGGYVLMIYYALIPPLWFNRIHPEIERIHSG